MSGVWEVVGVYAEAEKGERKLEIDTLRGVAEGQTGGEACRKSLGAAGIPGTPSLLGDPHSELSKGKHACSQLGNRSWPVLLL